MWLKPAALRRAKGLKFVPHQFKTPFRKQTIKKKRADNEAEITAGSIDLITLFWLTSLQP